MQLTIDQVEQDKTDYLVDVVEFLKASGIKTRENLESRFDILLTEYAMKHNGFYIAIDHRLIMGEYKCQIKRICYK